MLVFANCACDESSSWQWNTEVLLWSTFAGLASSACEGKKTASASYRHHNTHLKSKRWMLSVMQPSLRRQQHSCCLSTPKESWKTEVEGKKWCWGGKKRTEQIETCKNFAIERALTLGHSRRSRGIAVINTHSGESEQATDLSFPATPQIMPDAGLLFSRRWENKQASGRACRCLVQGILHSYEINRVKTKKKHLYRWVINNHAVYITDLL